jgi:hypothetical protein
MLEVDHMWPRDASHVLNIITMVVWRADIWIMFQE